MREKRWRATCCRALGRVGAGRTISAVVGGATRPSDCGDRHPGCGVRAGGRSGTGDGVGRRRRQSCRAAFSLSACQGRGDAARPPIALRRGDRGYARTAESQALVEGGWAHDLVAARPTVRKSSARISALDDSGYAQERDPAARSARLPMVALTAARDALKRGHSVLVQVPRRGYVPALACTKCRTVARCRHCTGPLAWEGPGGASHSASPSCRWCGRVDADLRCARCGSSAVRAVVVGARRTAEELGRALPGCRS